MACGLRLSVGISLTEKADALMHMRSRIAWLAGLVVAFLLASLPAGLVLAGASIFRADSDVGGFWFVLLWSTVFGFLYGGPAAGVVGAFAGRWCARSFWRGDPVQRIRRRAVLMVTVAGCAYGCGLALVDVGQVANIRWALVPAGAVSGVVVGLGVSSAVIADCRHDQKEQAGSCAPGR